MKSVRKHAKNHVMIDYPTPGEILVGTHYTFRMQSATPGRIELNLDGGEWLSCRTDVGYSWFDWTCQPGDHILTARVVHEDGTIDSTGPRRFRVEAPVAETVRR